MTGRLPWHARPMRTVAPAGVRDGLRAIRAHAAREPVRLIVRFGAGAVCGLAAAAVLLLATGLWR